MGDRKPKLDIKVKGDPKKLKNFSSVNLKPMKDTNKRYEATTASTFEQKRIEMINRRNSFTTSKVCLQIFEHYIAIITPWT